MTFKKFNIVVEQEGFRQGFFTVDAESIDDVKNMDFDDLKDYEGVRQSDNWNFWQGVCEIKITDIEEVCE